MTQGRNIFQWAFFTVLPKLPAFLLALPFVILMRLLKPVIWIRLIPISERLGHGLANMDVYLAEHWAGMHASKAIDIFYPDRPWKCNRQMIKMWKRLLPVYTTAYWIAWANQEIPGGQAHHHDSPNIDRDIHALCNDTPPPLSFTRQEQERGGALLHAMGIPPGSPIVCFHARDSAFLKQLMPEADWEYHNYRDVDIDTYIPAIKELVARGYYCIRMGRVVNKAFPWKHPQVIDYATGPWKSDFADMYLISRCRFYIGNSCGMDAVAILFRKPQVIVNMIPIADVSSWSPMYFNIFKRIWSTREQRLLTFKEILDSEVGFYLEAAQYKNAGLEVVDNTPDEILDAVIEKEERLRDCWKTNDGYEELQRKFWALFKPSKWNRIFQARVGSKFLLKNRELLENFSSRA